jgi:HEAT repeat protein
LSKYLDSPDYRAQQLVVNLLGYIGGKAVVKPLSYAAERSDSSIVRSAAVANLGEQPWADVQEIIGRVAANDPDPLVKRDAQAMIAKYQSISEKQ